MSQPTTREVIDGLSGICVACGLNGWDAIKWVSAAISRLEALADAEDARPEQPEAMEPVEVPRPQQGESILVDGERYIVGSYSEGDDSSLIQGIDSFGSRLPNSTRRIYWPHAIYSRVEACEGRK